MDTRLDNRAAGYLRLVPRCRRGALCHRQSTPWPSSVIWLIIQLYVVRGNQFSSNFSSRGKSRRKVVNKRCYSNHVRSTCNRNNVTSRRQTCMARLGVTMKPKIIYGVLFFQLILSDCWARGKLTTKLLAGYCQSGNSEQGRIVSVVIRTEYSISSILRKGDTS